MQIERICSPLNPACNFDPPHSDRIAFALRAGMLRFGISRRLFTDNGQHYSAPFAVKKPS